MTTYKRALLLLPLLLFAARVTAAQTDVIIAVDLSKSMQLNDPNGNRFIGADKFLTMFSVFDDAGTNRGGIVSFGDSASEVVRLDSLSFDQAMTYKPVLDKLGYDDWTELGMGLRLCRNMLGSTGRRKSVILISDGIIEGNPHTRGMTKEAARTAAERELWAEVVPALKSNGVRVYTVGLYALSDAGAPVMQKIADETGGFHTRVNNPEEFTSIYIKMLKDIGQAAGLAELTTEKNGLVLTPADRGVIIIGPVGYTVRSPDNVTYATDRPTPGSPVKRQSVEYSDRTAILFLGRPDGTEQDGPSWSGRWSVESLSGRGLATYISNVRLTRGSGQTARREYFLNELYQVEYRLDTRPGFDAEKMLGKTSAEYRLIPEGHSTARAVQGRLAPQGSLFKGEQLVEHEGNYRLEFKVYYDGVEKWTETEYFHVNGKPLIEIIGPSGNPTSGDAFIIEAKENTAASANDAMDVKGLVESVITFSLQYGSDKAMPLEKVAGDKNGVYRSPEQKYKESGDLEIVALLDGQLLIDRPSADGGKISQGHHVRALASRKIQVAPSMVWQAVLYGGGGISFLASVLGIYGFFTNWRLNRLYKAALVGTSTINLEPDRKPLSRFFSGHPAVSIGGPASAADIKDARLGNGSGQPVMEIGVNLKGEYYIVRTGSQPVYLDSNELQAGDAQTIRPNNKVFVKVGDKDVAFQFTD